MYAQWTAYSNRAPDAPYRIYNNGSLLATVRADQRTNGGQFNLLGSFVLEFTGTVDIVLSNDASELVVADAVQIVLVGGGVPVAQFSAGPASGAAPLQVSFTDESAGDIDTWEWDFNNDGVIDSAAQHPTFT